MQVSEKKERKAEEGAFDQLVRVTKRMKCITSHELLLVLGDTEEPDGGAFVHGMQVTRRRRSELIKDLMEILLIPSLVVTLVVRSGIISSLLQVNRRTFSRDVLKKSYPSQRVHDIN